jgi:hypothetical protein
MKRLAAMQDWPLLMVRASTAVRAARSRSALGITMNGSLPPSSSTVFLMSFAARLAGHLRARRLAAGERHRLHARIADNALHLRGADQQRLKYVRRKPRSADHVFDFERALRHVGGMLQQPHVARHQRRSREPEHLPERKIPGHDGQHRPDGLVPDEAAPGAGVQRLVRQQPLAVLHVVAAGQRAFGRLGPRRADGLPHLERHDAPQPVLLRFQNLGRRVQPTRAIGERRVAVGAPGGIGTRQRGIYLACIR